jgi:hypothetical protein
MDGSLMKKTTVVLCIFSLLGVAYWAQARMMVVGSGGAINAGARPIGLISLHHDSAPDADDAMAAAANKQLLLVQGLTNYVVVNGCTGPDTEANYQSATEDVFDAIFGSGQWYNAHAAWAASVQSVANAWETALDAGGDIWVAEAGQSDFTADVVAEIKSRQPSLSTTTRIHVVQHSTWNEDETTPEDLTYVQANTNYVKIDDGNVDNNTADLMQTESDWWKNMAYNNVAMGSAWDTTLTYFLANYDTPGYIDFSDTVEMLHILGISKSTVGGINDFATLYLQNRANNFASDTNIKSFYRFEAAGLTTDSKGTNTLTNNGTASANELSFKEGLSAVDLNGSSQYFSRTDANLSSGFPGKSGETNVTFSLAAWIRADTLASGTDYCLMSKFNYTDNKRSYHMSIRQSTGTDHHIMGQIGHTSGTAGEAIAHGTTLSVDTWYFVVLSYTDSTKAWAIRVRDQYGAVVGNDETGTVANNISVTDAPFAIGAFFDGASPDQFFPGIIDGAMVWSKALSATEVTNLAKGIYP